ncbi:MAG: redoxin domain-containing protein [Deltaproteobacteria bacterium]|nr:redoxin domain-containing protein [Deltaproteobacteria bacterium]
MSDEKRDRESDAPAEKPAKEKKAKKERKALEPEQVRAEVIAASVAGAIALPLIIVLGMALKDAITRADEAPLRSLFGDERFEQLAAGEGGFPHYLGHDRLVPDFTVETADGGTWRMEDQRGKVVIMNFWSETCAPCLEEMPSLELLAHMAEEWDDVEVVAISTDAGMEAVAEHLPQNPRLTHLFDPDKSVVNGMFGTELYPETFIIDPRGVVRFRYDGARDWSSPLILDLVEQFR